MNFISWLFIFSCLPFFIITGEKPPVINHTLSIISDSSWFIRSQFGRVLQFKTPSDTYYIQWNEVIKDQIENLKNMVLEKLPFNKNAFQTGQNILWTLFQHETGIHVEEEDDDTGLTLSTYALKSISALKKNFIPELLELERLHAQMLAKQFHQETKNFRALVEATNYDEDDFPDHSDYFLNPDLLLPPEQTLSQDVDQKPVKKDRLGSFVKAILFIQSKIRLKLHYTRAYISELKEAQQAADAAEMSARNAVLKRQKALQRVFNLRMQRYTKIIKGACK
jgi:hypothetical protein